MRASLATEWTQSAQEPAKARQTSLRASNFFGGKGNALPPRSFQGARDAVLLKYGRGRVVRLSWPGGGSHCSLRVPVNRVDTQRRRCPPRAGGSKACCKLRERASRR